MYNNFPTTGVKVVTDDFVDGNYPQKGMIDSIKLLPKDYFNENIKDLERFSVTYLMMAC